MISINGVREISMISLNGVREISMISVNGVREISMVDKVNITFFSFVCLKFWDNSGYLCM